MTDQLYDTVSVETAIREALRGVLAEAIGVYAGTLPVKAAAPYVFLQFRAPALAGLMMSGDQQARGVVSTIATGRDHKQAGEVAADLRRALIGRDRHGAFTTDIDLPDGLVLLQRTSLNDGAPDNPAGIPQWAESYPLTIGRA